MLPHLTGPLEVHTLTQVMSVLNRYSTSHTEAALIWQDTLIGPIIENRRGNHKCNKNRIDLYNSYIRYHSESKRPKKKKNVRARARVFNERLVEFIALLKSETKVRSTVSLYDEVLAACNTEFCPY